MKLDHDQIFKQIIEAFFREFMELFCPAEAALIDFTQVEFLREEFFTDVRRGRRKRLDLVVKVGLKKGGQHFILVHFEFEGSRKDDDFPRRMFEYFCPLFLRHQTHIVPIAVFSDDVQWTSPIPSYFELKFTPQSGVRFDYHLIKLSHLDYRQFLKSQNPLAYALMAKMKYSRRERVRLKADFLRLILRAGVDPARQSLLVEFVEAYMPLQTEEQIQFEELIHETQEYEELQTMVTVYEKAGIQKGIEQGIEQGIEKGRLQGKLETLLLLLENRFSKVPTQTKRKIQRITSVERIDKLVTAALTVKSLRDLPLD